MLCVKLTLAEIEGVLGVQAVGGGPDSFGAICSPEEAHHAAIYFVGKKVASEAAVLARRPGVLLIGESSLAEEVRAELSSNSRVLIVTNVRRAMCQILEFVDREKGVDFQGVLPGIHPEARIHPMAFVDSSAQVEAGAEIFPFAFIGPNVKVGARTKVLAGAVISKNTLVGADCVIRENCVVGGNGFGIEMDEEGNNLRIPHLGGVIIGDNVEIGALNTICSGTMKPTVVGGHSKFDDHVHVAHNDVIQENVIVTAGVVLSGSVVVERHAWLGVNASVKQGLTIGSHSVLGMGACVTKNVDEGITVIGNPARPMEVHAGARKDATREDARKQSLG